MRIVVLGAAGKMAKAINAYFLEQADISELVLADQDLKAVEAIAKKLNSKKVTTKYADYNDHASLVELLKGAAVVMNSSLYYGNLKVMDACLETGTNYVDLGGMYYMAIKQLERSAEFEKAGLTGIVGTGSAPGMVNVMARYAADQLDEVESIRITNGARSFIKMKSPLPATYALASVLDEFTINAMIFEGGEFKEIPPYSFSKGDTIDFPEPIGRMTSYPTIHTETYTLANSFRDKGVKEVSFNLALPDVFREHVHFLVELGFGSREPINVKGVEVSPRDVLLKLVSQFPEEDVETDDYKCNRVVVKGKKDRKGQEYVVEMNYRGNKKYRLNNTALTTGVGGAIVAYMLAKGEITQKGFFPVEKCVEPIPYFRELAKWGMQIHCTVQSPVV